MPCFATTLFETWLLILTTPRGKQAADEASCWDTCDVEPGCMAAVYNGTTCWHTATVLKPNNVEYRNGVFDSGYHHVMQRNESMYEKNSKTKQITWARSSCIIILPLNACSTCTGYNKLVDIDAQSQVQIGDANANVSERMLEQLRRLLTVAAQQCTTV
jgi:hypothetical protein